MRKRVSDVFCKQNLNIIEQLINGEKQGPVVQLVWTLDLHSRGRGFKSPPVHFNILLPRFPVLAWLLLFPFPEKLIRVIITNILITSFLRADMLLLRRCELLAQSTRYLWKAHWKKIVKYGIFSSCKISASYKSKTHDILVVERKCRLTFSLNGAKTKTYAFVQTK